MPVLSLEKISRAGMQSLETLAVLFSLSGAFENVLWNQMLAGSFSRTFDLEDRRRLLD
jgi:hypothetical protein